MMASASLSISCALPTMRSPPCYATTNRVHGRQDSVLGCLCREAFQALEVLVSLKYVQREHELLQVSSPPPPLVDGIALRLRPFRADEAAEMGTTRRAPAPHWPRPAVCPQARTRRRRRTDQRCRDQAAGCSSESNGRQRQQEAKVPLWDFTAACDVSTRFKSLQHAETPPAGRVISHFETVACARM